MKKSEKRASHVEKYTGNSHSKEVFYENVGGEMGGGCRIIIHI